MGTFNRLVNILILILALASVALSVLLFQKRENLVEGYKILAGAIAGTSAKLDEGSGTEVSKELQGSELAHNNFDKLKTLAPKLEAQAAAVIAQRDAMATALVEISKSIGFLEGQQIEELKSIEKGKDKPAAIAARVEAMEQAKKQVFNGIITAARTSLGLPLEMTDFSPEKYAATMQKISNSIATVKRNFTTYKSHSDQLAKTLKLTGSLPERITQAGKKQGEINALTSERNTLKGNVSKLEVELNAEKAKISSLNQDIVKKDKRIKDLIIEIKKIGGGGNTGPLPPTEEDNPALLKGFKAKVLAVNTKWDFVVLNIGEKAEISKDNVTYKVPIKVGTEMVIARDLDGKDSKFICNVKIVKLHEDCAIANVLPTTSGASSSDIDKGDIAYFSKETIDKLVANSNKTEDAAAAPPPAKTTTSAAPPAAASTPKAAPPAKKSSKPAAKKDDNWEGFGDE